MEIIGYGLCQVVNLRNVFRSQGAAYLPEVAAKVVAKYQFAKPPGLDDLGKEAVKFQLGKFNDVQIDEFGVYSDGVIVNGHCPTELLEEFLQDILSFGLKEIGHKPILSYRDELHFESVLMVHSKSDLAIFISSPGRELVEAAAAKSKIKVPLRASGLVFDFDPAETSAAKMRRKPARFLIERRVGINFDESIFHCVAPLPTKAHLDLLTALEREAAK